MINAFAGILECDDLTLSEFLADRTQRLTANLQFALVEDQKLNWKASSLLKVDL